MDRSLSALLAVVLLTTPLVSGCQTEILHDMSEPEANTILAVLQKEGIKAEKIQQVEGSTTSYTVAVKQGDAPKAWRVLRRESLPRAKNKGLGDVFGNVGLVPTDTQERALLRHALAGEVTETLNSIEGVRQARVHIVLPRREPLAPPDAPNPRPRASVVLKVSGKSPLSVQQVQQLVAGSVEDMDPNAVRVIISRAHDGATSGDAIPTVAVGPFRVAMGSRTPLLATLVTAVFALLLLGLAGLYLLRRNRSLSRALASAQAATTRPGTSRQNAVVLDSSISLIGQSLGPQSMGRRRSGGTSGRPETSWRP